MEKLPSNQPDTPASGSKLPAWRWKKFAPREENLVPEFYEAVENCGYLQLTITGTAALLGISATMMRDLCIELPDIKAAHERGKERMVAEVTQKFMKEIALKDGHQDQTKALMFALERKGGWKKEPEVAVQVNNLPALPTLSDKDLDAALDADWSEK